MQIGNERGMITLDLPFTPRARRIMCPSIGFGEAGSQARRTRGPGSGNQGGDADALAVEVPDQGEDRVGDAVQELHADLERFVALAGLAPDDPAVHLQELLGPLEIDDDVDDRADGEILFTADPGPRQGYVVSVGIDRVLRGMLRQDRPRRG